MHHVMESILIVSMCHWIYRIINISIVIDVPEIIGNSASIWTCCTFQLHIFIVTSIDKIELCGGLIINLNRLRDTVNTSITCFDNQSRSEEHTSELQSRPHLVCRLLLEKKKKHKKTT